MEIRTAGVGTRLTVVPPLTATRLTEAVMVTGVTPATAAAGATVGVVVVAVGEIRTTEWVSHSATCAEWAMESVAIPCGLLTGMEVSSEYDVPFAV